MQNFSALDGERLPEARCRPGPNSNPEQIRFYLDLLYSDKEDESAIIIAKELCAGCAVRSECLALAEAAEEEFGIWGGLTPDERNNPC